MPKPIKETIELSVSPSFTDVVEFLVTLDPDEKRPPDGDYWVRNNAFQDGELVYAQWQRVIDGSAGPFTLGPTGKWQGGAADGRAELIGFYNGLQKPMRPSVVVEYDIGA